MSAVRHQSCGRPRRLLMAAAALVAVVVPGVGLTACGGTSPATSVEVLGTWTGAEQDQFEAVLAPFEEKTGIDVRYEGTRDFEAVLDGRAKSGDAPDLALMPGLGDLEQYARDGLLVPLDSLGPTVDVVRIKRQYLPTWLRIGRVAGADGVDRQYGLVVKGTRKSLVWYPADGWSWKIPTSLDDLLALSDTIAGTGTAPWCLGLRSSSDSGWPGTDWVEDILLHQAGSAAYLSWATGELAWTSATVRAAFTTWGKMTAPGKVRGGAAGALLTSFGAAGSPMFDPTPGCYLHLSGSFADGSYVDSENRPAASVGQFAFPPGGGQGIVVAGDTLAMFHSTSASRRLVDYLTGPEAQTAWARARGTISPNTAVPLSAYPNDTMRSLARSVSATPCGDVVFDASDTMPPAMRSAFYRGVTEFLADPGRLDTILAGLDEVRRQSYGTTVPDAASRAGCGAA